MQLDFKNLEKTDIYKLMSNSIIPRPIAWIVTQNNGITNIAPFSYFTGLSSNPPTMIVSIGHKSDGTPKDTLANLRQNRTCTICIATPQQIEKMHFSSKELSSQESEAKLFDIQTQQVFEEFPPMVKDSQIAYFCTLHQEVELKGSKTIPIIVEIQQMHIDDNIITDKENLHFDVNPIARVGRSYNLIGKEIEVKDIP